MVIKSIENCRRLTVDCGRFSVEVDCVVGCKLSVEVDTGSGLC